MQTVTTTRPLTVTRATGRDFTLPAGVQIQVQFAPGTLKADGSMYELIGDDFRRAAEEAGARPRVCEVPVPGLRPLVRVDYLHRATAHSEPLYRHCRRCQSTGQIHLTRNAWRRTPCPACHGTGHAKTYPANATAETNFNAAPTATRTAHRTAQEPAMTKPAKTTYTATHPETGETLTVTKGGRPIKWLTFIDFGGGKGLQWAGFSSQEGYAKASKAARGSNPYGVRYDAASATPVAEDAELPAADPAVQSLPATPAELTARMTIEPGPAGGFPPVYAALVAAIGHLPAAEMYHDACLLESDRRV